MPHLRLLMRSMSPTPHSPHPIQSRPSQEVNPSVLIEIDVGVRNRITR
jgi:hypothetical protein